MERLPSFDQHLGPAAIDDEVASKALATEIVRCFEKSQCEDHDAVRRLIELSTTGDVLASGFLIIVYQCGFGTSQNVSEAQRLAVRCLPWLTRTCEEKTPEATRNHFRRYAQYILGTCYYYGLANSQKG